MEDREFRVLITKEEDMFVAQMLEHDICVQAPDISTLERRLIETIAFEMADEGIERLPPAPERSFRLFEDGRPVAAHMPNAEVRLAA